MLCVTIKQLFALEQGRIQDSIMHQSCTLGMGGDDPFYASVAKRRYVGHSDPQLNQQFLFLDFYLDPVEWRDLFIGLFVHMSVRLSTPLGRPARPDA